MGSRLIAKVGRRAVKRVAIMADALRRPGRGAVVLIYHRVGTGTGLELDMPLATFRHQAESLAGSGRVCTLDAALAQVAHEEPAERDPVVLTVDDGTADFVDQMLPVLTDLRLPVLLYLATDFVESGKEFPYGGRPLSWSALGDAVATGLVTVGSHTHGHVLLDRLDRAAAAAELDRSIELIEDRLGVTPRHFAYPKAVLGDEGAQAEVRQRFASAAIAGTRPNEYGRTDPYRLARSPIQASDAGRGFERKLAGGMALEDDLRQVLNRRRYANATT